MIFLLINGTFRPNYPLTVRDNKHICYIKKEIKMSTTIYTNTNAYTNTTTAELKDRYQVATESLQGATLADPDWETKMRRALTLLRQNTGRDHSQENDLPLLPNSPGASLEDNVVKTAITVRLELTSDQIKNLPLTELLLRISNNSAAQYDTLVRAFAEKVNDATRRLKALSDIKAALAPLGTDNSKPGEAVDAGKFRQAQAEIDAICKREGISINWNDFDHNKDGIITKGGLQKLLTSLDGQTQSVNSYQNADMTQVQNYTQKYNQAYELGSNFMKKLFDTMSGLIANMR